MGKTEIESKTPKGIQNLKMTVRPAFISAFIERQADIAPPAYRTWKKYPDAQVVQEVT